MDDEEHKEKRRRRDRETYKKRFANDPDFREKRRTATRESYRRNSAGIQARRRERYGSKNEEVNAQRRERYATDPVFRLSRLRKYGINVEEMQQMMVRQHEACGICEQPFHYTPHIDHCHVTGLVRGLLCRGCNLLLGHLKDNPDFAHRIAAYLERWILHVIELHIGKDNHMPSNQDPTEENKAAQLIRDAILHELNQPFGVEPPPPDNWLQAVSRALVSKAAQDLNAIKEVFDRVGGKASSAPGASEAARQVNVTWKYPPSKLHPPSAGKTTSRARASSQSSKNGTGASPAS